MSDFVFGRRRALRRIAAVAGWLILLDSSSAFGKDLTAADIPAHWRSFLWEMQTLQRDCQYFSSIDTTETTQSDTRGITKAVHQITFSRSLGQTVRRTAYAEQDLALPPDPHKYPESRSTGRRALEAPIPQLANLFRTLRRVEDPRNASLLMRSGMTVVFPGPAGKGSELEIDQRGIPLRWASYAGGRLFAEELYEWRIVDGHRVPARIVRKYHSPARVVTTTTAIRTVALTMMHVPQGTR